MNVILFLCGVGCLVLGIGMISLPAGIIAAGVGMIALSAILSKGSDPDSDPDKHK